MDDAASECRVVNRVENEMKHTAKDRPDPIERAETDDEGKSIVKVDYEAGT
ncbi:hypothetical protein [Bradyrhizobium sp. 2S1]|nr:hypothetical protein [Bradyrhizobium sp. 2S1]MCK7673891.1 hypothetical protein [Bradyrhizobium sp. 2S1]